MSSRLGNQVSLQKELIEQLAQYIEKNVDVVEQVLREWPDTNQQLSMPSITIFTGEPVFSPFQPEVVAQRIPTGATKGETDILVGEWDYVIQLDLWASNKEERSKVFDAFFTGFNQAIPDGPMGLSLRLPNYYGVFSRFDIDTMAYVDDEASVQRGERRAKIKLLCNVPALRTVILPIMKTIETQLELPDNISI